MMVVSIDWQDDHIQRFGPAACVKCLMQRQEGKKAKRTQQYKNPHISKGNKLHAMVWFEASSS